jgi:hypothetical protein
MPLWTTVEQLARAAGLGIAPACEQLLRPFVDQGDQRVPDGSPQRPEAEANLERFIRAMIEDARAKGYNELHEDTFSAALTLCPLFPFC